MAHGGFLGLVYLLLLLSLLVVLVDMHLLLLDLVTGLLLCKHPGRVLLRLVVLPGCHMLALQT
jgi:hypothetical protein